MSDSTCVAADELMASRNGTVDPAKAPEETFDLYSIPAFDRGEPDVLQGRDIGSTKQPVMTGDVLLSKIVPHIRRAWIVGPERGRRQIASSEWIVFRSDRFEPSYLRHYLTWDGFHAKFLATVAGVGGSLLRARPAHVARLEIPLPPLPEQKRIADILDKADAIRRKRHEAAETADSFLTSAFNHLFGDPVTNPHSFDKVPLSEIAARVTVGIVIRPASYYVTDGVPALRSLNVRPNRVVMENLVFVSKSDNDIRLAKTRIWKDDIVLIRSGQPGTAAVVPKALDGANAVDLLIVTPDARQVDPHYLSFYFNSSAGRRLVLGEQRGQIQQHLNAGSLRDVLVPLPPLEQQLQFRRIREHWATYRQRLRDISESSQDLFGTVVQRAFKGELS